MSTCCFCYKITKSLLGPLAIDEDSNQMLKKQFSIAFKGNIL